MPLQKFIRVTI